MVKGPGLRCQGWRGNCTRHSNTKDEARIEVRQVNNNSTNASICSLSYAFPICQRSARRWPYISLRPFRRSPQLLHPFVSPIVLLQRVNNAIRRSGPMGPISLHRLTARVTKVPYFKAHFTATLPILGRPFDSFDVPELWMRISPHYRKQSSATPDLRIGRWSATATGGPDSFNFRLRSTFLPDSSITGRKET